MNYWIVIIVGAVALCGVAIIMVVCVAFPRCPRCGSRRVVNAKEGGIDLTCVECGYIWDEEE